MRAGAAWLLLAALVGACGGNDGGAADAQTGGEASVDVQVQPDTAPPDASGADAGALDPCVCPATPGGGACRGCDSADDGCVTREGWQIARRCVPAWGCLQEEACGPGGAQGYCTHDATCAHDDPADVVEPAPDGAEPAPEVAAPDIVPDHSKSAGMRCDDGVECLEGMECVSGQYTAAHCNTLACTSDDDCAALAPAAKGQCMALDVYHLCIWFCGAFGGGAPCPGDLTCDGATCG